VGGIEKVKAFPRHEVCRGSGSMALLVRNYSAKYRSLYLRERTPLLLEYKLGWAPESVCVFLSLPGFRLRMVHSIA
jgi:hypothetical protein